MKTITLLTFIFVIQYSLQVFIVLDPYEKRCIYKDVLEKKQFSGVYYFSGQEEDKNIVTIIHPNNKIIWKKDGLKNGSFNLATDIDGQYALCFEITADIHLTVSFDFHDQGKEEQLISVRKII